jgi:cell wall-associated NlpC family hydrolase
MAALAVCTTTVISSALLFSACAAGGSFLNASDKTPRQAAGISRDSVSIHEDMTRIRPASMVATGPSGAEPAALASLEDPYTPGYSPTLDDGDGAYQDPGLQLIDPVNAVAGLTGSLWTSKAGENLVSGVRAAPLATPIGASLSTVSVKSRSSRRDRASETSKSMKPGKKGPTSRLLTTAFGLTGRPFRQGQNSPQTGFDNAGYVSYVYSQSGIRLPRKQGAADLASAGKSVSRDELRPGDLVVYDNPKSRGTYLLGVYSGNGNFLLSSPRLKLVTETAAFGTDYGPYFIGARRLYDDPDASPLSEEEKMAVTNGAVKTALSNMGEIPRLEPVASRTRTYSKSKSKSSRSKSKVRAGRSKSSKKSSVSSSSKAKAKSKARTKAKSKVVKRRG